jgi:catechol 2,3-dioxygenase-like lactoylglutathione lyase family enzyme
MQIKLASIFVDDQEKALRFYTDVLGFVKKADVPTGEYRWLTVVSPEGHQDVELLLEPNDNPAAQQYQRAIYDQGIPATVLFTADVQADYERLHGLGVRFLSEPVVAAWGTNVIFDDTCGNLINLVQL